jgi:hypothetical protein
MFTYQIWFKSGNNIEGDMDEENSKELTCLFLHRKVNPDPWELKDSDGPLIIDITQVEAISFTPLNKELKSVGFGN